MISLNSQPPEKTVNTPDSIDIQDIFPTIQGEGPFVGRRSVFIRLAGCNLQCPMCDTDYTSHRRKLSPTEILDSVRWLLPDDALVVITGGEPFRQDLSRLLHTLQVRRKLGGDVQIETNGTIVPDYSCFGATVVCSPKTMIPERMKYRINHLKYVVKFGHIDPVDGLPLHALGLNSPVQKPWSEFTGNIYIQPLDEQDEGLNRGNMQQAISSCMKFGYILSPQIHKICGLP